jgi:hypothetical protein
MRTEKQIAASRANGARSRGPKSKTTDQVAANYGILAQVILLKGESRRTFDAMAAELTRRLDPQSPFDHMLIGRMLVAHWRQIRLWTRERAEETYFSAEESRLDRQFYRAYDRYRKFRPDLTAPELLTDTPATTCENPEPEPEPTETQPN